MKKRIVLMGLLSLGGLSMVSCSSDDNTSSVEKPQNIELPTNSKSFLDKVFPNSNYGLATTRGENYFNSYYKLAFSYEHQDLEIDFDKKGNWTEIESEDDKELPLSFLESEVNLIYNHVKAEFPGLYIVEIDREDRIYEVTLNSDLELIYNAKQEFIGIDIDKDDHEDIIEINQVPKQILDFVAKYFGDSSIILAKSDDDKEVKVYLSSGYKLEFNSKLQWEEIEGSVKNSIPSNLLPEKSANYLQDKHPSYVIVDLEFDDNKYEVELKNKENPKQELEIVFDKNGEHLSTDFDN